MNYKVIIHTLGWVLGFEGISMIFPLICSVCYGESQIVRTFAICIAICLALGITFTRFASKKRDMYAKEGFMIVGLSWIVMSIFGALPFVISGSIPNFIDALFETASGFTTTGASILSDVEALPKGIVFWRSFTHWIGGMGVLVFLVSILPLSGGNNFYMMKAESQGPAVGKIVPRVKTTAKILYEIYTVFTIIQIVLLLAGGMSLFDSITTAFGTAGTGGFGIRNSSMGEYSTYIQNVITIFMIVFGVDFSMYYLLLIRRGKDVLRSEEVRGYLGIIVVSTLFITFNVLGMYDSFGEALKHSAFQVASIITTTGFSTTNFDLWPEFSKTILVVLMFIGACAGSTGGGIKVSRVIIMLKSVVKTLKMSAHPKSTHKITMNGRAIEHETIRGVNVFIISYLAIFVLSLLIISLDNFDFTTNFTAITSMINNIGPGLAKVGPMENFAKFSQISKIVFVFDMLAGRLGIFPILILFSSYTWKK